MFLGLYWSGILLQNSIRAKLKELWTIEIIAAEHGQNPLQIMAGGPDISLAQPTPVMSLTRARQRHGTMLADMQSKLRITPTFRWWYT